ncbi:uncharacterized protein LOC128227063 isoform X2 [Mya arenaria]|uniref:uncharacterized protein LOC128227063 isoform X2 n=1 Tax=Mya arenaria TaxID=6604 RepID=UPI0022E4D3D2|nr:uncharacterized protein LOC128227063 isoform X2 [Mya arenaria]
MVRTSMDNAKGKRCNSCCGDFTDKLLNLCRCYRKNKDLSNELEESLIDDDHQHTQNEYNKPTIQSLKYDEERLETEIKKLQNRIEEEQVERQTLFSEKEGLIHELEELRTRLSAVISAQVTDSNPNIADLSDKNRPTQLAERYSELYDNQWTECYDGLTNILKWEDKESMKWILGLFINIFQTCEEKASKDLEQLRKILKEFQSGTTETLKTLKDKRKKSSMVPKDQITAKLDGRFAENKQAIDIAENFINESVELCWLMAVQDPPVYVDTSVNTHGQPLDTNHYKYYTQKGELVDYVVWPVLFLTIEGPLLSKGIAQGLVEERQSEENQTMIKDSGEDTPESTKL